MKNFILKQGGALLCAVIAVLTLNLFVWAQGTDTPDGVQVQGLNGPQAAGFALFDEATQKYIPVQSLTVIRVMLDGQELTGDVPAFLYEERTLIPLRLVSEALKATVEWSKETRQAVVTEEETTLVFTLGSPTALVNGEERALPDGVSPCLASVMEMERTMVPLRFLAETLDFEVEWEEATQTVYLTAGRSPVEEVETSRPPLAGFLVALDAGHGGYSSGAYYEKVSEKDLDLTVTLRVAELLKEKGCEVLLTRSDDTFVSLSDRCQIANDAGADIFVSIHANASDVSKTFQGIYTYHYPGKQQGKALAKSIQNALVQETGAIDRGVLSEDFAVVRMTQMPASLVEIGFMSCHEELLRLCDPDYQEKVAQGIAQGIEDYLTK